MDISPVLLAVCGLSIICIGLIVVIGFIVIRFTGGNVLLPLVSGFLNRDDLVDNITGEDELDKPKRSSARTSGRRSPGDLRSKAQSLDFDSALAKYQQPGGKVRPGTPPIQPTAPPSRFSGQLTDSDDDQSTGKLRRSRRSSEDHDIIDDEADGDLF